MLYQILLMLFILYHIVTRMSLCLVYYVCPLLPPNVKGHLPMIINWIPTTGLTQCQIQPGPAYGTWSPLGDISYRKLAYLCPWLMVSHYVHLYRTCLIIWQLLYHTVAQMCHLVDQAVIISNISCMPPCHYLSTPGSPALG